MCHYNITEQYLPTWVCYFVTVREKNERLEFIDAVFAKTSPKRLISVIENERFGFVCAKTGSINSGTVYS